MMSSMSLATIVSRRQFMTHELVTPLRWLQGWCCKRDNREMHPDKRDEDTGKRDERENTVLEWQLDGLSAIYVEIHRLANNDNNPASHGVPLNGNTPLSAVLELTAVGQSTFDTRYLLLFFAAMTAICGFAQKLGDDGEIDVDTAWTHIMSNYVMIVFPYCLLAPFVFRKDIFKERSPYQPSSDWTETWRQTLESIEDLGARKKKERELEDEKARMGLMRNRNHLRTLFEQTSLRKCNNRLSRASTAKNAFSCFSPFTKPRNSFEL